MMLNFKQALPLGWNHSELDLHRVWYLRRVWQWKARVVAGLTVLSLITVLLGADKLWLLFGLIGVLIPIPMAKNQALIEIEKSQGENYTTALVAPIDQFGFSLRLLESAKYVVRNAELPALPWLEGLGILLLVSLAFVLPAYSKSDLKGVMAVNQSQPNLSTETELENTPNAAPVLNAPAAGEAPEAGQSTNNGKAASGGTPGETGVGDLKSGGGNSTEDPEAISRDFLDALERGAVNKSTALHPNPKPGEKQVQDLNSSNSDPSKKSQSGTNGNPGGNSRNGNKSGQNGKQPGSGQQNGNQSGQNGQNGNNPNDPSKTGKNGKGQQNQNAKGQNGKNGTQSNGADRFDRGENGDGSSNPGQTPDSMQGRGQPGQAGRNGGTGRRTNGIKASQNGKLEYIPGQLQGNAVRSGAMQLPGDPKRPLSQTPGSAQYRRAVESAVLDPRLPPEYQELLKNYYK